MGVVREQGVVLGHGVGGCPNSSSFHDTKTTDMSSFLLPEDLYSLPLIQTEEYFKNIELTTTGMDWSIL